MGTLTNDTGGFRLQVPTGDIVLLVRFIGFQRVEVPVSSAQTSVQVALQQDVLQLEGMIVTGQATSVSRRNAATAVATVSSEELTRTPATSLEAAMQGKVVGANINMNSGAPGGGGQIQIRGVTSILGNGEPLFVIDGVIMSNASYGGGANSITRASGNNIASNQDNPTNRLADINPADIASIEVLKGAAASAIYGAKATNGVIVITTKRGESGSARYSLTQRVGQYSPAKLLHSRQLQSKQDAYRAVRVNGGDTTVVDQVCDVSCPYYDYQADLFGQRDPSYETSFSVSGGSEGTRYLLSATGKVDNGTMINTGAEMQSLRLNLDHDIGSRVTANVSTAFVRNIANRGISNNTNNNTSPFWVFGYTPALIDLNARDETGKFVQNPFAGGGSRSSNPFETLTYLKSVSKVNRVIASGRVSMAALQDDQHVLTLSAVGGVDWFDQDDQLYSPNFLQFEPADGYLGTAVQGNVTSQQANGSLNAVWTYTPPIAGFLSAVGSFTTSAGLQYEQRSVNQYNVRARGLVPGVSNVDQGTRDQTQSRSMVRDQAFYAQEEVLAFNERLLLSGGFRAERSSVNGDRDKLYIFPKVASSFRFVSPVAGVDEVKVRASIASSGNQPQYAFRYATLINLGLVNGRNALGVAPTVGNPRIEPERMTEREYGVDASILGQRLGVEATFFDRTVTDLLLQAPLASTSGLTQQIINGGEISSQGWEVGLTASPIRRNGFDWVSRVSWYTVDQRVVSLPVPAFNVNSSGFGAGWGRSRIAEGYSTTAIWGNITLPDGGVIDTVVGEATPDFQMQFGNTVQWKALSLNVLVDWRKGGDMSNMTNTAFDEGMNSWDYDHPSPEADKPLGQWRYEQWRGGRDARVYIQDGSFVKLREVSVSLALPERLMRRVYGGIADANVSLSGRNLFTWSDYWGVDPEANNFGNQTVTRIVDLAPYPPSRSVFLTLGVGF